MISKALKAAGVDGAPVLEEAMVVATEAVTEAVVATEAATVVAMEVVA